MADLAQPMTPVYTEEDASYVSEVLRVFAQLHTYRAIFAQQWEEVAQLILPEYRNTFFYGSYNFPGQKKTDRQVDATGMLANARFAAICDSLLTPANQTWQGLIASNPYVMKQRGVRLYFEETTRALFQARYTPTANFMGQNHQNYVGLGGFGNMGMFIDELYDPLYNRRGLRYRAIPLGELFLLQNHQGMIDGFIRWFRLTARQCLQQFGKDKFPPSLVAALNSHSEHLYDFLHYVHPRTDYDPERYDARGKPWKSCYVSMTGAYLLQEGGYSSFPLAVGRYMQAPGEVYGRGPAMMVLPALKTLNFQKAVFLKQGHRAVDPILLAGDDGLVDDFKMQPGKLVKGGVSPEGRPLIQTLPAGDISIAKEMLEEERNLINDAFLVKLFQILTDTPQMSATEVIERTNEKGILLAPTVGRQIPDYLGTMTDRELEILARMGKLPAMPEVLKEAGGEYEIVASGPLAKSMRSGEAAGAMRTLQSANEIAKASGDNSVYDEFAFNRMVPGIAEIQSMPESWMATAAEKRQKAQTRQRAQQMDQQIKMLPSQAAMVKAQATAAKAGVNPGQPPGGNGGVT